jgi:hypothetical protein
MLTAAGAEAAAAARMLASTAARSRDRWLSWTIADQALRRAVL